MASVIKLGKCIFPRTYLKSAVTRHGYASVRGAAVTPSQAEFNPQQHPPSLDKFTPQLQYPCLFAVPQNVIIQFRSFVPSQTQFITPQIQSLVSQNILSQFRSLEPPKPQNVDSKVSHLSKISNFNLINGLPRTSFFKRKSDKQKKPKKKRIPKLILIQNPLTWLMIKIDFSVLKNIWDPTFAEKDFKFGTKQAISRVTSVISDGQYSELNGLLTKPARVSLMRELDRNWSERQRSLLALKQEDIQISSPRKVYFIRIADKKFCDVDMAFLALKWAPINSIDALIFTEIFARFHREYTPHCIPEWTIAYFKVTRFEVLRRK